MGNVFQGQRLFYCLPFIFKFRIAKTNFFLSKWLKSSIISAGRKSCKSSGWWIICQSFRGFLNYVVVGKREGFLIFFQKKKMNVNSNSLSFQNTIFIKIFDTKDWTFHWKPVIEFHNFYPFLEEIEFSLGEMKWRWFFSLLVWYPLEQPNAKHLSTIFVKQNNTENFWNSMLKYN